MNSDLSALWPPPQSSASTSAPPTTEPTKPFLSQGPPPPPLPPPPLLFNQETLQKRLQTLIEGARDCWTYAIFWQSSYDYSCSSFLGWGDGYYKGEEAKAKGKLKSSIFIFFIRLSNNRFLDKRTGRSISRKPTFNSSMSIFFVCVY